ncbi:QWRF motif-containing protein 3 [Phtheirospermum japonicum]|uniref:QWRF motif-containing protein 3 n=1 Tax=Phtheirospermum japonicum TaxID=374723 RepID=A0A830CML6_9LAMI|nr:QWRF motif-containing protein 3 [Phtheirospermum japonicum]
MNSHGGATAVSRHSSPNTPKNNKPKSREVSSRFLSSTSSTATSSSSSSLSSDYGNQSPNSTLISSPKQKPKSSNTNSKKHKSYENSGFFRGLWPSSSPSPNSPRPDKKPDGRNPLLLNRQRSCTEFSRFENEKKIINYSSKENQKPVFGGSMRYTGKFKSPEKSVKPDDQRNDIITPGRFSVDENTLRKKSSFSSGLSDTESEYSAGDTFFDTPSAGKYIPAPYMAPTVSSRKHGIEVPSKFMHDISSSRSRRWSADSGLNQKPVSSSDDNNNSSKIFTLKSLTPGRSGSQPGSANPSRGKGVGNILSMGIGLLKGKKSSSSAASSPLGPGSSENVHQLRLLHNRLMQWRYSNARAEAVNENIIKKAEIKALENWENMETQHLSAVCTTIDYLHSVVCRVPLVDGAKVEPESASLAVRHASDLAASINLMLTTFSPTIEKTVGVVGELATVVTQEKLLLEECFELYKNIAILEVIDYLQQPHPDITS